MTLGITIPSPSGRGSPASDDSSQIQTPISPSFAEANASAESSNTNSSSSNGAPSKRKAARRANTAERRATHNAVERARRETLNGRFLDLAALLPNLSQIRRPSKSAIVNSSIAHVHASRRHRQLASRELRLLKLEADALRRELNEWRDRAGIPRVQEPVRGDGFSMILSGEIEILPIPNLDEEEGEYLYGDDDGNGFVGGANEHEAYVPVPHRPSSNHGFDMSMEQQQQQQQQQQMMMRRGAGPLVASPGGMAVENPAMGGMMFNNGMNPIPPYSSNSFMSEMDQSKWGPGAPSLNGPLGSDIRRSRSRAMSASTSSSGGGSPPLGYFVPGWNAAVPQPNIGAGVGGMMPAGGGSVGGNGAVFSMMM